MVYVGHNLGILKQGNKRFQKQNGGRLRYDLMFDSGLMLVPNHQVEELDTCHVV